MRPKHVAYFEILSLAALALGAVLLFLTWGGGLGRAARITGSTMVVASILSIAVTLALILLTSRKRSNVAKWILVVLTVASAAMRFPSIGETLGSGAAGLLDVASLILQIVALYFLFTPDARAWFARRADAGGGVGA